MRFHRRQRSLAAGSLLVAVAALASGASVVGCKTRQFNQVKATAATSPDLNAFSDVGVLMRGIKNKAQGLDLVNTTTDRREWEACFLSPLGSNNDPWKYFDSNEMRAKGWKNREDEYLPKGVASITSTEYRVEVHYKRTVEGLSTPVSAKLRNRVRNYANTVIEENIFRNEYPTLLEGEEARFETHRPNGDVVADMEEWKNDKYYGFADLVNLANKVPPEWIREIGRADVGWQSDGVNTAADSLNKRGRRVDIMPQLDRVKFFEWKESFTLGESDSDEPKFWSEHGSLTGVYKHRLAALKEDINLVLAVQGNLAKVQARIAQMQAAGQNPLRTLLERKLFKDSSQVAQEVYAQKYPNHLAGDATFLLINQEEGHRILNSVDGLRAQIEAGGDAWVDGFIERTLYLNFVLAKFFGYRVTDAVQVSRTPYDIDQSSIPLYTKETRKPTKILTSTLVDSYKHDLLKMSDLEFNWVGTFVDTTVGIYKSLRLQHNTPIFTQNYVRRSYKMPLKNVPEPAALAASDGFIEKAVLDDKQAIAPLIPSNKIQGEVTMDRFIKMVPVHNGFELEKQWLEKFNNRYSPDELVCVMTKLPPSHASLKYSRFGTPFGESLESAFKKAAPLAPLVEVIHGARNWFYNEYTSSNAPNFVFTSKPRLYPLTFKDKRAIYDGMSAYFKHASFSAAEGGFDFLESLSREMTNPIFKNVVRFLGNRAKEMVLGGDTELQNITTGKSGVNAQVQQGRALEPQLAALVNVMVHGAYYATQTNDPDLLASTQRYDPLLVRDLIAVAFAAQTEVNAADPAQVPLMEEARKNLLQRAKSQVSTFAREKAPAAGIGAATEIIQAAGRKVAVKKPEVFLNSPLLYFVNLRSASKDPSPVTTEGVLTQIGDGVIAQPSNAP